MPDHAALPRPPQTAAAGDPYPAGSRAALPGGIHLPDRGRGGCGFSHRVPGGSRAGFHFAGGGALQPRRPPSPIGKSRVPFPAGRPAHSRHDRPQCRLHRTRFTPVQRPLRAGCRGSLFPVFAAHKGQRRAGPKGNFKRICHRYERQHFPLCHRRRALPPHRVPRRDGLSALG